VETTGGHGVTRASRAYGWLVLALVMLASAAALVLYALPEPAADGTVPVEATDG
jgi:hypothetical protein